MRDLRPVPIQAPPQPPQIWPEPAFAAYSAPQPGLEDVLRKMWSRKLLIAGITLACVVAGAVASAVITPRFQAESRVLVGVQAPRVLNVDSILSGLTANSETLQSEAYVVTSRTMMETVARRLELDRTAEFNPALRERRFSLTRALGIDAALGWVSGLVRPAGARPQAGAAGGGEVGDRRWDRIVASLASRVEAVPLNRSHVISIVAQSENPQLAARISNAFGEVYLEQQIQTKQSATESADQWLQERIAQLREQVNQADQAVEEYRRKHGLYETRSDTVIAQQLAELNREQIAAQNALVEAETRFRQARAEVDTVASAESLPAVLQSPLIQTLRGQQSELEQRAAELSSNYTERHPQRRHIQAQIDELDNKIKAEAKRIVASLEHQLHMATDRYQRVRKEMAALQNDMGAANQEAVTLRQLEREAEANRGMLVALLQRSKETVGQHDLQAPDARLISRADVPLSPSYPPSTLMVVLAGFVGLGSGTLLALLLEGGTRTFRTREDVETETGLPVLAVVPAVSRVRRGGREQRSRYWDAVQMMNTRLCLETESGGPPASVLFTSALAREGKTSLGTAYAKLLAREGQRVVIVELDWKRPSLHTALGRPQQAGLAELLHGIVTPEEAVYRDPETGLHAIFAGDGDQIERSNVWLARLRLLLGTLTRHYDVIILDSAPVSVTPEILHVARLVEQTVFVVKWHDTPRRAVANELASLQRAGASVAGVVLSRVNARRYRRYAYEDRNYAARHPLAYGTG